MTDMDLDEAMGIAAYIAKVCPPTGDGSIEDRKLQVPVVLAAEIERLRARDAAATAVVQAARAWKAKRDSLGWPAPRRAPLPEQSSITEAADLYDAVTALDGLVRAHRGDQT